MYLFKAWSSGKEPAYDDVRDNEVNDVKLAPELQTVCWGNTVNTPAI